MELRMEPWPRLGFKEGSWGTKSEQCIEGRRGMSQVGGEGNMLKWSTKVGCSLECADTSDTRISRRYSACWSEQKIMLKRRTAARLDRPCLIWTSSEVIAEPLKGVFHRVMMLDLCFRKIILATVWRMDLRGASWRQGKQLGSYCNSPEERWWSLQSRESVWRGTDRIETFRRDVQWYLVWGKAEERVWDECLNKMRVRKEQSRWAEGLRKWG